MLLYAQRWRFLSWSAAHCILEQGYVCGIRGGRFNKIILQGQVFDPATVSGVIYGSVMAGDQCLAGAHSKVNTSLSCWVLLSRDSANKFPSLLQEHSFLLRGKEYPYKA